MKDLLLQRAALVNRKQVSVFTVRINNAVGVNRRAVDTPFESVGMIRDAGDRPVGVSCAAQGVCVLELPLDPQSWAELSDEVFLGTGRVCGGPVRRTERIDVTIRAEPAVVIVLDYD